MLQGDWQQRTCKNIQEEQSRNANHTSRLHTLLQRTCINQGRHCNPDQQTNHQQLHRSGEVFAVSFTLHSTRSQQENKAKTDKYTSTLLIEK